VRLADHIQSGDIRIETPENIQVETPPLFIPGEHRIYWRIRAKSKGKEELGFLYDEKRLGKHIAVDVERSKLSPKRTASFATGLLYPAETLLSRKDFLEEIHLHYPHRSLMIFGMGIHWFVLFFVFSMVAGFACKNVFGVEI
jgi:hypothetical protein